VLTVFLRFESVLATRDRSRTTTRSLFFRLSIPFRTQGRGVDRTDKRGRRVRREKVDHAARAAQWEAMIDGETIRTRTDLARHLGVSRARVTQVLGSSRGAPGIPTGLADKSE